MLHLPARRLLAQQLSLLGPLLLLQLWLAALLQRLEKQLLLWLARVVV
jgi:hypothetical protein